MLTRRNYTFDAALQLKDSGLVAASAAAQVDGFDRVIPVGDEPFQGVAVIQVDAIEIASGDEHYVFIIQGSNSATFASGIENLAAYDFGAAASGRFGGAQDSITGRYELPFINQAAGVGYAYLRGYTFVSGAVATGINFNAFIAPETE